MVRFRTIPPEETRRIMPRASVGDMTREIMTRIRAAIDNGEALMLEPEDGDNLYTLLSRAKSAVDKLGDDRLRVGRRQGTIVIYRTDML